MIKKVIVLLILSCAFTDVNAQLNFVRNGSFEKYTACPTNSQQAAYSIFWNGIDTLWDPTDSIILCPGCYPTYINGCSIYPVASEPNNTGFYHYPHTGNAMMCLTMYGDTIEALAPYYFPYERTYLQTQLTQTLTAGQSYCVTFFVLQEKYSAYNVNNIGAYLDDGIIDTCLHFCGYPHPQFIPQIVDTNVISDTLNWTKVQGSFIANGTENYITIGNLYDTGDITHVPSGRGDRFSLYLVDDITVIPSNAVANAGPNLGIGQGDSTWIGVDSNGDGMPCMWYVLGNPTAIDSGGHIMVKPDTTTTYIVSMNLCGNVTTDTVTVYVWPLGVSAVRNLEGVKVYPNPTADFVNVSGLLGTVNYHLTSVVGSVVKEGVIGKNANTIDVGDLASGVYLLEMSNETGEKNVFKVVKE